MPEEIKENIMSEPDKSNIIHEISEENQAVYLAVNKKLFVWDYSD